MQVTVGKKVYTVLFPDLLRPLTGKERAALKRSIKKSGIQAPVVVDESGGIIDGANRAQIAEELGFTFLPTTPLPHSKFTMQEKAQLALALNVARRHMKPKELEDAEKGRDDRIARAVAAREKGMSLRAIAEAEGVSKSQVAKDLDKACQLSTGGQLARQVASDIKDATVTGDTVAAPDKVLGLDGKKRPATRKPKAAPAAQEPATAPPPPPPVSAPVREPEPPGVDAPDPALVAAIPPDLLALLEAWDVASADSRRRFVEHIYEFLKAQS